MGPDGTIRAEFDWSMVTPCMAVVETLAVALGRESTAFEPLYESVDPDALDAIVRPDRRRPSAGGLSVQFTHAGHDVTVRRTGTVVVRPVEPRSA